MPLFSNKAFISKTDTILVKINSFECQNIMLLKGPGCLGPGYSPKTGSQKGRLVFRCE